MCIRHYRWQKKIALLLHYVGEDVYNVYDSFTDEQKGIGAVVHVVDVDQPNEHPKLKKSLTDYSTHITYIWWRY